MLMHSEENSVQKVKIPFRQLHQATLIHTWLGRLLPEIQSGHCSDPWTQTDGKTRSVLILYLYLDQTNHSPQFTPCYDGVFCGSSSFAVSWLHWDQAMVKPGLGSGLAGLSSRTHSEKSKTPPLDQTKEGNSLRSVSVCGFHPQSSRGPAQKVKKKKNPKSPGRLKTQLIADERKVSTGPEPKTSRPKWTVGSL